MVNIQGSVPLLNGLRVLQDIENLRLHTFIVKCKQHDWSLLSIWTKTAYNFIGPNCTKSRSDSLLAMVFISRSGLHIALEWCYDHII